MHVISILHNVIAITSARVLRYSQQVFFPLNNLRDYANFLHSRVSHRTHGMDAGCCLFGQTGRARYRVVYTYLGSGQATSISCVLFVRSVSPISCFGVLGAIAEVFVAVESSS